MTRLASGWADGRVADLVSTGFLSGTLLIHDGVLRELQSIANYQNFNPAVSPAFNTSCTASCTVLTCSCTSGYYWSSTSQASNSTDAWFVDFGRYGDGFVGAFNTSNLIAVRGVRGGS